eukprot:96388-Hanusia_phi.AAC.1
MSLCAPPTNGVRGHLQLQMSPVWNGVPQQAAAILKKGSNFFQCQSFSATRELHSSTSRMQEFRPHQPLRQAGALPPRPARQPEAAVSRARRADSPGSESGRPGRRPARGARRAHGRLRPGPLIRWPGRAPFTVAGVTLPEYYYAGYGTAGRDGAVLLRVPGPGGRTQAQSRDGPGPGARPGPSGGTESLTHGESRSAGRGTVGSQAEPPAASAGPPCTRRPGGAGGPGAAARGGRGVTVLPT